MQPALHSAVNSALLRVDPPAREESDTTRQGLVFMLDGSSHFRVWAPNAAAAYLEVANEMPDPVATVHEALDGEDGELDVGTVSVISLRRDGDDFVASIPAHALRPGAGYRLRLRSRCGERLRRRDPYALRADTRSSWCIAVDPENWRAAPRKTPPADAHLIYELHVGSFAAEGTFAAARRRLRHIADLGFTCLQLLPVTEHADAWGLAPRHPLAVHGRYGTPEDFRELVEAAHALGLAVLADVPMRCCATPHSALWAFDGALPNQAGGMYYDSLKMAPSVSENSSSEGSAPEPGSGGAPTKATRTVVHRMAYNVPGVQDLLREACAMMLAVYGCDGVRLSSADAVPRQALQGLTYHLHERFPGKLVIAQLQQEDPGRMEDVGLDAVYIASARRAVEHLPWSPRASERSNGAAASAAWDIEGVRGAVRLHDGFTAPVQCVKALLGSHADLSSGGEDPEAPGTLAAAGLAGGGRNTPDALAAQRAWYAAGVAAAGRHMAWMGQEHAQAEWRPTALQRAELWGIARDDPGRHMMEFMREANDLRSRFPVLHRGACSVLHEDSDNGVIAWERTHEGLARMVTVLNMGPGSWQQDSGYSYGVWVGHGSFREVFSTRDAKFGGPDVGAANVGTVQCVEGRAELHLPSRCALVLLQVGAE